MKNILNATNTKLITTIYLVFFMIIQGQVFAQLPSIEWEKTLGGTESEFTSNIQQTMDGGFILSASTKSIDGNISVNNGARDAWIVKLDIDGEIEWQKSYGGSNNDFISEIIQTDDSGFIMTGYSESNDGDLLQNKGASDAWIVKLNNTGEVEWQQSYGGTKDEITNAIRQTIDGGYIIAGQSNSNDGDVLLNHGKDDYWILKLNSMGEIEWQRSYGGTSWESIKSIELTTDGGYVIAGHSTSNDGDVSTNYGNSDLWIVKINDTGDIIWEKSFGGTKLDRAPYIKSTTDNGYILAGSSFSDDGIVSTNYGGADYWIIKLDDLGDIVWEKSFGGSDSEYVNDIQQTHDDGYIVIGSTQSEDGDISNPKGSIDYWVVKLNTDGAIEWEHSYGGSLTDYGYSVCQTTDNGFVIAGTSTSNDGDVTFNNGGLGFDNWIIKLTAESVTNISNEINQLKIAIYPNPFNTHLQINHSSKINSMSIFDINGRLIQMYEDIEQNSFSFDTSKLLNGPYILSINTNDGMINRKIIK